MQLDKGNVFDIEWSYKWQCMAMDTNELMIVEHESQRCIQGTHHPSTRIHPLGLI